jgi:hypothetical protein
MQNKVKRKTYYVNGQIQGALILRVMRYWLLSLLIMGGLTFLGWMFIYPGIGSFIGPDAILSQVIPVFVMGIVSACLLLPIALRDSVRFSNRFVGPMIRIQRAMEQHADGQDVQPIRLRDGDYWHDFAAAFNRILEHTRDAEPVQRRAELEQNELPFDQSTCPSSSLPVEILSDARPVDSFCNG